MLERSGLERHGRMRSASALRREGAYSATVAKRTLQLQEMRDKLKEKHRKNDMLRLKHQLTAGDDGGDPASLDVSSPDCQRSGLLHSSAVKCEHLVTVATADINRVIGSLSLATMTRIDACLKAALAIP